ncbi:UNVERIFIED_CONTAM: hypothetical protein RMT77_014063 [Armadillidium vulgare]
MSDSDCISILTFKYLLTTAFLSGLPTSRNIWNQIEGLLTDLVKIFGTEYTYEIINEHSFGHNLAIKYPKSSIYIKSVKLWFKIVWEKHNWFPNKFNITSSNDNSPDTTDIGYKTYFLEYDHHYVTLLESFEGITMGTTGLSSWGASKALFSWCSENSELVLKNKRIIELGAGVGYTAACVLSLKNLPEVYTATDYHPTVLSVLHHNLSLISDCGKNKSQQDLLEFCSKMRSQMVEEELPPGEFGHWCEGSRLSYLGSNITVQQLDWRRPTPVNLQSYDVILASDVVYARHLFSDLVKVIRELLSNCQNKKYKNNINKKEEEEETKDKMPYNKCNVKDDHKRKASGEESNCPETCDKYIAATHDVLHVQEAHTLMEDADSLFRRKNVQIEERKETKDNETRVKMNENDEKAVTNEISSFTFPTAFVACTKRDRETLSDFLNEITRQGLRFKIVYQATLGKDEALFSLDESYKPVIIYQITL